MDELTLDGKIYISSKHAAKVTGYAKDYVGQLCREGRVEARLVGRNWYVLEESIREHRFGADKNTSASKKAGIEVPNETERLTQSSWKPSVYVSETPPVFPVMDQANSFSESKISSQNVVEEMQTAWQDWFKHKNELAEPEELLLESPEIIEERAIEAEETEKEAEEEVQEVVEEAHVPMETFHDSHVAPIIAPVSDVNLEGAEIIEINKPEAQEDKEEVVRLHRSYSQAVESIPEPVKQRAPYAPPARKQKGFQRSKSTVRSRKSQKGSSAYATKTFLVLVSILALSTAAINTGYFDNYFNRDSTYMKPFLFLVGESILNKQVN